jgi:DNA-binding HxlR family transcriptional regulator
MTVSDKDPSFNASRAELFEALSHPLRLQILTALNESPRSFAELKHLIGIDSSGHLAFHLQKLADYTAITARGEYTLSDDGHEAYRLLTTIHDHHPQPLSSHHRIQSMRLPLIVVCIILVSLSIHYYQYQAYQQVVTDNDALQTFYDTVLRIENSTITKTYAASNTASRIDGDGIVGVSYQLYPLYTLFPNTTLTLDIHLLEDMPEACYLPVQVRYISRAQLTAYGLVFETYEPGTIITEFPPILLDAQVTHSQAFTVALPAIGLYYISVNGPETPGTLAITYTITFQTSYHGSTVVFLSLPPSHPFLSISP